ncbi:peptide/nickel transport system permease protein [Methanohalophilus levihalophilus]|uniref:ABC transporter permease n=1 Tax=Methanohalophilus levihalophilus TaxID=1431282 RepID=UPI001AE5EBF2|nr:ABC transporter permease [Methanohalophilus levihalophilus]MBP2030787.1 peptide/nickel transport system permease protein [Methanohalophilus levihalophilus]
MYRYIFKRIVFMVITVFAVFALTFFLMNVIPGGTSEMILKHTFIGLEESATDEQLAQVSERYNLNDPLYLQFFEWIRGGLLEGDLGTSFVYHKPVLHLLMLRLPATIVLAFSSMLIASIAGVSLGVYAALRENRFADHLLRILTLFGVSMPGFWVGLLLILIFSVYLKLVPVAGYGSIWNLILPAIALSIHSLASIMRVTRTSMLETLGEDYIKFATAKGLPVSKIISRHALKNSLLPVVTVLGFQMGAMLGGSVVIEKVFAWPGIGSLLVDSIFARDLPVVQACIIVIVLLFLVVNFIVDLVYIYLDPRIRYG